MSMDCKNCKKKLSKAKYVFTTRIKFIDEIRVFKCFIYITMQKSTSIRVNRDIENFIKLKKKTLAAFALRKDTSTNLLTLGVVSNGDITSIEPSISIQSNNGKFYKVLNKPTFRIRVQKEKCFNVDVKDSLELLERINSKRIGFVCPKMSSGKTPYVRGLLSLLGPKGKILSKDGRYNRKNISCFIKL